MTITTTITLDMITGRSTGHLATLSGNHRLHSDAVTAFQAMQAAAREAGFDLQPASTFRDFQRQQAIWNAKFRGERPVLDADSRPIDISIMSEGELCRAILRWSALPGASRHHWGSDLDIYDPSLLPAEHKLQLEPWEYNVGGYFHPLTTWLSANMKKYGFYRPFENEQGGVAVEPWHLSYYPLANQIQRLLTPTSLLAAWENEEIAGSTWLVKHLDEIFAQYITKVNEVM